MQYNENDFYTCPYCKSAKDQETNSRIDEKKRYLKVIYLCGTEIEIEFDGPDCSSNWKVVCVPQSKIN